MSAARPKVGDYPFTTLTPHLGVVEAGDIQFVAADVPGLIPGASQGKGLGLDFLRHVERCLVLVHVLDCTAPETSGDPSRNPVADFDVIEAELDAYQNVTGSDLRDRPRIVVLNKIDVPAAREVAEQAEPVLAARGLTVCQVSAATREGVRELAFALAAVVAEVRAAAPAEEPTRPGDPAAARGRAGVRDRAGRGEHVPGPGRQAVALGAADRLRQRRGRRLPRRPAGQARRGRGPGRGGRRGRRRGDDRQRGRGRGVRLGAPRSRRATARAGAPAAPTAASPREGLEWLQCQVTALASWKFEAFVIN